MVRHDLRAAFRGAAAVIEGKGAAAGPTRNPVAAPTSMALSASRMRRAMLEGTGWIEDSRVGRGAVNSTCHVIGSRDNDVRVPGNRVPGVNTITNSNTGYPGYRYPARVFSRSPGWQEVPRLLQ
eukprot:2722621-Rhodomonas_salina.1